MCSLAAPEANTDSHRVEWLRAARREFSGRAVDVESRCEVRLDGVTRRDDKAGAGWRIVGDDDRTWQIKAQSVSRKAEGMR